MASTSFHSDDRENLSALFDGELDDDAARFAHKRLGHDAQWRETCGRWQLCGDVLRGHARGSAAPGFAGTGFADRVAAAIAADAALQASRDALPQADAGLKPRRAAGSRRGWIGGAALAASVAVAALFVARPFSDDAAGGATDPAQVAAQSATVAQTPQPNPIPAPAPVEALAAVPAQGEPSLTSADASGIAAGAIAVAEIPRRLNERRSRGQSQRAAVRASERQSLQPPLQIAAAAGAATPVVVADAAAHANPFRPQQSEVPASRPWPRAALPNYQSAGSGYAASYGNGGLSSPSFYPFEPAVSAEDARTRPSVQERPQPQP
ncbi:MULTISPECIES: sigma-E factor negative regulatory protein [Lysobacter]|uniref:sigma-E factor negative regulatory protein n=1 Tax=Lysobacter TaxID=68 RepID=UPI001F3236FB|nr:MULTISPECIES: sigma-E factor negative regulatory protein [Lysobacter]UJB17520.1 sigma-E factor negative regulatory protein [Lysobacter capsici]UJQ28757.1 sigma-E factor negative regulatory protein [Lysobacter gummosus]